MNQVFPYANIITGILILVVGFVFHWIGQLISILNWDFATKIGIQEIGMPPEYKVYEHGTAIADAAIGWIYGIAGVGLILGTQWSFRLAWVPGVVMIYHSISFLFISRNQRKAGHRFMHDSIRVAWFLANSITGALAILVAWNGC